MIEFLLSIKVIAAALFLFYIGFCIYISYSLLSLSLSICIYMYVYMCVYICFWSMGIDTQLTYMEVGVGEQR